MFTQDIQVIFIFVSLWRVDIWSMGWMFGLHAVCFLLCHLVVTTYESPVKSVYEGITGALTVSVWLQLVKSWVFDQIGQFYLEQWSSTIKLGDSSLGQHYINSEQFLEPVLIHSKGEADSNDTLLQSLASLPFNFLVSPLSRWAVKYGW